MLWYTIVSGIKNPSLSMVFKILKPLKNLTVEALVVSDQYFRDIFYNNYLWLKICNALQKIPVEIIPLVINKLAVFVGNRPIPRESLAGGSTNKTI